MDADLKFGDVIRFEFCGGECIAMVVLVEAAAFIVTDEGTQGNGKGTLTIFGLVSHGKAYPYHGAGQTASFHPNGHNYEVLP